MNIQATIDARAAELESALRARIGDGFRLHVLLEAGPYPCSRIFYSDKSLKPTIVYLAQKANADEALTCALQAIRDIRTYEDECRDLGIEPARQPAGAERECTCGAPPEGDGKCGDIHSGDCPALSRSAA